MKKKKINYFIVEVDLYKVDVMVVVGDIEGAIKWLENKNVSEDDIEFVKSCLLDTSPTTARGRCLRPGSLDCKRTR